MASSEDEFGGYGPTTPAPSRIKPPKPGQSSGTSRTKPQKPIELDSDGEEIDNGEDSLNDRASQTSRQATTRSRKPASRLQSNGKPPSKVSKAKGKGKATTSKPLKKNAVSESQDAMDVDQDIQDVNDSEADVFARDTARIINSAANSGRAESNSSRVSKQDNPPKVKRLEQQVEKLQTHIQSLQDRLKKVLELRETEPELQVKLLTETYQAQVKSKDILVQDLLQQVRRNEPLQRDGPSSVLNLVTRDVADEERRGADEEVHRLRGVVEAEKNKVKAREEQINQLESEVKELKFELKLEKEKVPEKSRSTPVPKKKGHSLDEVEEPKHAAVINFYEELTSILVTSAKRTPPQYLDKEEWSLTCVYTLPDDTTSINFQLRICWDLAQGASEPVHSESQLTATIHYSPLFLENETESFRQRVSFLCDPFTFTREQLPVFLGTLHTNLTNAVGDEEEESNGEGNSREVIEIDQ